MKSDLVKRVGGLVLVVTAVLLLLSACGGGAEKASPTPTVQQATPTVQQAAPTATPTTAAVRTPTSVPSATPTTAAVRTPTSAPAATPTTAPVRTPTPSSGGTTPTPSSGASGEVVQVKLSENPYAFTPENLSFQSGKTYTLQFNAPLEAHTFTVADLGIDIYIDVGKPVKQVVTFKKAGTFKLICIVHETLDMVGKVTVN